MRKTIHPECNRESDNEGDQSGFRRLLGSLSCADPSRREIGPVSTSLTVIGSAVNIVN